MVAPIISVVRGVAISFLLNIGGIHIMRLSLSLKPTQRQEQVQTIESRQEQLVKHVLTLRTELILALHNERYQPEATCPNCHVELTSEAILIGFNHDPNDFTTSCPLCNTRFRPKLVCLSDNGSIEMPFYCDIQSLSLLKGMEDLTPEQLKREHSEIYRSTIYHYGTIRNAFNAMGVRYEFGEIENWSDKIQPFLGRLPDTVIAKYAGQPVSAIRRMRNGLGIPRYIKQVSYDEIDGIS